MGDHRRSSGSKIKPTLLMTFGSRRDCATSGRFQRFSLISLRLGEGRLAGLNGRGFGRTDSAKQLEAGTMTAILDARTAQDSETPATPVFAAPIRHPSAWTVADFRSPADYSVDLDAAQLCDIAAAIRSIKAAGIGLDGLQREHFEVPSLRPVVEEIRRQVEDGRGFVLLRRLPVEDYSKDDLGLIFWGIGTHLGRGLSQSVMGDRLGHVKDFSREDPGARAYRNKQELSPHTDSCDLVGLLCLRNAQAGGGVSRLTSAISVHNDCWRSTRTCSRRSTAAMSATGAARSSRANCLTRLIASRSIRMSKARCRCAMCAPTSRQVRQRPGGRWAPRNAPSSTR